ncbi:hypothetical protein JCM10512_3598 [Bacteroides reticulotermitis JCM 10512]|uniref:Uncharacterized protein n=2 Tax=Bacteroides reticulotermitis TaxID=1133319 RepID=W4UX55_9BACE|nr:hypothetical protein JCM10512_3598 [Bacteroides reticulotermitis JCM 10512]
MYEVVEFVKTVLAHGRRVVIEHFDLLYPALGVNADMIVASAKRSSLLDRIYSGLCHKVSTK